MKLIKVVKKVGDKMYTGEKEFFNRAGVRATVTTYDDGTTEVRFSVDTNGIMSGGEKEAVDTYKVLVSRAKALKDAMNEARKIK